MAEDAEAAFLRSMQVANEGPGIYGATSVASEQLPDSSSDEYDPAQAVQADSSSHETNNLSNNISHVVASNVGQSPNGNLRQQPSLAPGQSSANPAPPGIPISNIQDQSIPMSRSSTVEEVTPKASVNDEMPIHRGGEQGGGIAQSISNGDLGLIGDTTDPASHSLPNASLKQLSAADVSIQNDMQDQPPPEVIENGTSYTVPNLAAVLPDTGASFHNVPTAIPTETLPAPQVTQAEPSPPQNPIVPVGAAPKARLPHDRIGILEDRIKEDPRGDLDAWLSLVGEHRKRGKINDARTVYERFFVVFPQAAEQWVAYAQMENEAGNRDEMEKIFSRTLMGIPNLQLWSMYLDHVRRHHNTSTDASGEARQIIHQAYDFALQRVGLDKESGKLWQEYVQFIKSGPGVIGGSNWQDQQKMDLLRKTYQRAICIPTQSTNILWKEYDGFEMGLNKMTGRKFLQDQSPAYMTARSSYVELQNITRGLRRTTLPVLPPALGFDGDVEYKDQLDIWKRWIKWEKDDPLVLKQEDIAAYRARIVFVYRQALMAMRFWPELWFDAADFCFLNELADVGNEFLTQGIAANPESCLLAFKRADRIELTTANEEGDESAKRRGAAVRECYDKVLDALYDLITKARDREAQDIARIEASFDSNVQQNANGTQENDNDEGPNDDEAEGREKRKSAQIEAVKNVNFVQVRLLTRTISYVWIALMRAMRRIQGKGKVGDPIGGSRQIFTDARKRGRITSDVYVASALIEFHCYEPEATKKIFERGLKLFPEDEGFALEYIRHLIANNDHTNARVVFETVVNKLGQKPETVARAKPLYAFFHDFESRYGELSQITKLEKRMSDLFPEDQRLTLFSRRFVQQMFDPTAIRPIISPATQARPKALLSVEAPVSEETAPNRFVQANSPKRPLPLEESDNEGGRPRKLARGESPLKGAAGRRLDQQKRNRQPYEMPQFESHSLPQAPPTPLLPRDVLFLLGIIPKAETYHATKFKAEEMVRLIRETNIPSSVTQLPRGPIAPGVQPMPVMHVNPQLPHNSQMPQRLSMPQMHQMPQMPPGQYNGGYSEFSSSGCSAFAQPKSPSFWHHNQNQGAQVIGYSSQPQFPWPQDGTAIPSCPTNPNTATGSVLASTLSWQRQGNPSAPSDDIAARLAALSNELQRVSYSYRR